MKALLLAYILANGCDAGSTQAALNRGRHEALLTQNHAANYALIGGQTAVGVFGLQRLSERRPKLARTIAIAAIVGKSYIAVHNMRGGR